MARQMKDSGIEWIGEIPETWETSRVGLHYSIILGKMLCPNQVSENYTLVPYFCAADVHFDGVSTEGLKQMWFSADEKEAYIVHNGDLLVVEGGAGAGGCAIARNMPRATYIQNSIMIVRKKNGDNRFLRYLIEMLVKRGYIDIVCNKATIPHFTKDKLANVPLPILSDNEMSSIADFLDRKCAEIDAVIERTKATIEEYKKLKQAVITEAVTKGVRGPRPMKDSGIEWIGEIPEGWEARKLSGLSERIVVGVVIRPSEYFDEQGSVPFIRGLNVKEYRIVENDFVYITEESNQLLDKSIIHTGDVLIVRDGSIGTSCVVPPKYDGANVVSLVIVTTGEELLSDYLCYLLNSDIGKHQFEMTKIGSALTHTSVGSVSKIKCLLPSVTEQQEIIEYLDTKRAALDTLIAKKTDLLTELETYKKSLIYEYVTGKKEVL